MSDARPVGVFDSGIGGFSVLREIRRQHPSEHCLYVADTIAAPYGTKGPARIRERCERIVDFLLARDAKAMVVACNTASVAALPYLRAKYDAPFVGIVPAVKPAAVLTRSGVVGVLATPTTARSRPLAELIERFAYGVRVITQVCPELVTLIERGVLDGPEMDTLLRGNLSGLLAAGADVIVLGCTHFPLVRASIQRICGPDVALIDPSEAVARQVGRVLAAQGLTNDGANGSTAYFTTGEPAEFGAVLSELVGPVPLARVQI